MELNNEDCILPIFLTPTPISIDTIDYNSEILSIKNFQKEIANLKSPFSSNNLKKPRKCDRDSITKKIKVRFCKFINSILKNQFDIILNIPQSIISNVTVKINKKLLKQNLNYLVKTFNLQKNHSGSPLVDQFFEKTFEELFKEFLSDEYFSNCVNHIKLKYGSGYASNFKSSASSFIDYYQNKTIKKLIFNII